MWGEAAETCATYNMDLSVSQFPTVRFTVHCARSLSLSISPSVCVCVRISRSLTNHPLPAVLARLSRVTVSTDFCPDDGFREVLKAF